MSAAHNPSRQPRLVEIKVASLVAGNPPASTDLVLAMARLFRSEGLRPYYDDGHCVIYHGDCRELLLDLGTVDLVLTDPPYGIGKAEWDVEFPTTWMAAAARLTPRLGIMPGVWNIARCPHEIGPLTYRWTLAAYLTNGMTRAALGFGNWIPCMVWSDPTTSLWQQDGDSRAFVIGQEAKPDHPSPKPLRVMSWFVSRIGGDLVLDPFMGSGTTLVAAKNLGKRGIGIEIEERYCEIAAKRLAQEVLPIPRLVEVEHSVIEQSFSVDNEV